MTREEAIKTIRLTCPKISDSECDFETAMRFLIPELAESEDERVRKWIASYIHHGVFTEDEHPMALKAVEWLEKQKENPKSADSIPSDCVSDAKCEDKSPKHSDSDGTDIRDTPAYWKGWDDAMKQKEQKHPNGCFTCDEYKKGYEEGRRNGFTAGYNKAMKEIDQKEQKPEDRFEEAGEKYQVEWNEEDENMFNDILLDMGDRREMFKAKGETTFAENTQKKIDWLDSHHLQLKYQSSCPQPKQEWSEEDRLHYANVLEALEYVKGCKSDYDKIEAVKSDIAWLKSLRPSWRPSEEQMNALAMTVTFFKTKWTGAKVKEQLALESLYEDLKKLM